MKKFILLSFMLAFIAGSKVFSQTTYSAPTYHQFNTNYGYLQVGPQNTGWAHIYTDRPAVIFNKPVYSIGGVFSSYSSDNLYLQTGGITRLTILNNGNVGIATFGTGAKLNLKTGWKDWIHFESNSNTGYWAIHNNEGQKDFQIYYRDVNGNIIWPFNIRQDGTLQTGSLGINTSNLQGYKLAVNGGIVCEEVKVITDVPDADYVFDANYNLKTISELETFVKEQKHLPNIPSAEQFKKDGYKVGEMDEMLLRKVEEFSLYLIEQNKRIEVLEKENKELKTKLNF